MTRKRAAHRIARRSLEVLVAVVLALPGGSAQAMPRSDWTRIESLPPGIPTRVRLHTPDPGSGRKQITGLFESSSTSTITLMLRDGQSKTIEQSRVRKIIARRKVLKRYAGWITLVLTLGGTVYMGAGSDPLPEQIYVPAIGSSFLGFWLNRWRKVYRAPRGSHN